LSLSAEQMAGVLEMLADDMAAEEQRKFAQAERKRRQRERDRPVTVPATSRDSHVTVPATSRDSHVTVTVTNGHNKETRAMRVEDNLKPLETSGIKKEEKETTAPPSSVSPFDEFWRIYPKRIGDNPKKPARLKFEAECRRGTDPQAIIAAVRRLAEQHPTPSVYVPQAITWLNQDRWTDEPTQTGPPADAVVKFRTVEEIFAAVEERKRAEAAAAANAGDQDVSGSGSEQRIRAAH
jgi:hypothetical protein